MVASVERSEKIKNYKNTKLEFGFKHYSDYCK